MPPSKTVPCCMRCLHGALGVEEETGGRARGRLAILCVEGRHTRCFVGLFHSNPNPYDYAMSAFEGACCPKAPDGGCGSGACMDYAKPFDLTDDKGVPDDR
jgi:hypothetical protein